MACLWKFPSLRSCLYNNLIKFGHNLYNCVTTKTDRARKENMAIRKEVNMQKANIRENLKDLNLLNNLELQLQQNKRTSLPELSRVSFNEGVEFDHGHNYGLPGGAHGGAHQFGNPGVQWHQLTSLDSLHEGDERRQREASRILSRKAIT